jgi:hypothetical protein
MTPDPGAAARHRARMVLNLDSCDLRMALAAVSFYRQTHIHAKLPIPPAADRLADHLEQALSVNGQEDVAPQPQWITTAEFACRMGCSERTARRRAAEIGRRVGRVWLIPADALPEEENENDDAA